MATSYAELYDRISRVFCLTNDITPAQKAGIESILKRRDVFISTRTGSGKSLCYQALPLASDNGITLVVCPLLSIMKEQVSCMNAVRIKSTYIGKYIYIYTVVYLIFTTGGKIRKTDCHIDPKTVYVFCIHSKQTAK